MNSLEKQVLRIIGENVDSPDVFTDDAEGMAPVRDSINDAIQEINALTGGYTEQFYIPLVASKTFYRLSFLRGYFGWVEDCWLFNQKRRLQQTDLITLNRLDPRWLVHTGTPEEYVQVGPDIIGLSPKPSATSDVLELTCAIIPSAYTHDDDRIKLRDTYTRSAINYAVSEYYAGRGDARTANAHLAKYLESLGDIIGYRAKPSTAAFQSEKFAPEAAGATP